MTMPEFIPPGPGTWELDDLHITRPMSRLGGTDEWLEAFREGQRDTFARYGALLDTIRIALVNRFMYTQVQPFGAPPDSKPPPAIVFKLLTRLHPAIRRRLKVSQRAIDEKIWREDLRRWREEDRPRAVERNRTLREVAPAALDVEELIAHIDECHDAFVKAHRVHHSYNATLAVPIGDLMVHAAEWAGAQPQEVLEALRGTSPISAGDGEGREELVGALQKSAAARELLGSSRSAEDKVRELRAMNSGVGDALERWLAIVGTRPFTGVEISARTVAEVPEALIRALSQLVDDTATRRKALEADAAASALRRRVPEDKRTAFDELVEEARSVYSLRDERNLLNDAPLIGLCRRAALEAGARLADAGKLKDPEHAIDLTRHEIAALLRGDPGPSADEAEAHVRYRIEHTSDDAPRVIGGEPSAPPDFSLLPRTGRRTHLAVDAFLSSMFGNDKRPNEKRGGPKLSGLAASGGIYEGRARVVSGPQAFDLVEKGDVLVARSTAPSYNVLLPLLGGIVTDRGGPLCHAAIVAREYGIPGVVGTGDATTAIPDGARVRIDGDAGTVEVLE